MTHDDWKTAEGSQYDVKGYVEFVTEDFLQHACDCCEDLADFRIEAELDGKSVEITYRCSKCHAEICESRLRNKEVS